MANIDTPIPSLKLNDGNAIPMLGYGLGTAWYKTNPSSDLDDNCIQSCLTALNLGYHHLDGAEAYKTETEQGKAIAQSKIDRSDLFITTKVSSSASDIPSAIRTSLSNLGLDHVDLYLIHSPWILDGSPAALQKAWAQMEQIKQEGLAKSIGISNFLPDHIEAIMQTAKIVPAINQIEFHAYLQRTDLLKCHKKHGIATAAYSPLAPITKAAPGPIDGYVAALAKKYAVSEAEILLRWCVDQDVVAITTSGKEQRLSDYLRAMTFKLSPREIKELNELGQKKNFRGFWTHKLPEGDWR
ncbi:hypothetical protein MBLNU457_7067t1 [Dothideomycetes sp. NU457]